MEQSFFKNYWFWVVAVLVSGIFLFYLKLDLPSGNLTGSNGVLVINYADGHARKFVGPVEDNMTVLQALNSASAGGNFTLRYSLNKNGDVVLAALDGLANVGMKSWHFYLNQKLTPTQDIGRTKVRTGDVIEVKYE